MKKFRVVFQPSGRSGEILEGKTILEASRELGVGIESVCGGEKTCGKCKVKWLEGKLSPFTDEESKFISEAERLEGYRLACAAQIKGDVITYIPEESLAKKQIVRKDIKERSIELKPAISLYHLELSLPTLNSPLGDFDRLKKALSEKYNLPSLEIDYQTLLKLPSEVRQGNWKVTVAVWMGEEIIDVKPGKVEDTYGLAIDIGTTTVAAYLCNLRSGNVVATEAMMNPQVTYGEDVMSRISYVMTHPDDGLEKMNQSIIGGLNHLIRNISKGYNLIPGDILELVIVGNTVMHHLFLKINPQYLGVSPFPPTIHQSIDIKARELGVESSSVCQCPYFAH